MTNDNRLTPEQIATVRTKPAARQRMREQRERYWLRVAVEQDRTDRRAAVKFLGEAAHLRASGDYRSARAYVRIAGEVRRNARWFARIPA